VHRRSARDLPAILDIVDDLDAGRIHLVVQTLDAIALMLADFRRLFQDVWTSVDPDVFYDLYRPLLSGSTPQTPIRFRLPDGTIRDAVAAGPSAGQSTIFVILDAVLLLEGDDDSGPHAAFQGDMLAYMPPSHRALALTFRRRARASALAKRRSGRVGRALRRARAAYAEFRRFHFLVATRYLRRTATGTGGTDFRETLQDAIARTAAQ